MSDEEDDFRSPLEELAKRKLSYKDYDPVTFDVLKVNPEDFASQITLKDLPVFKAITPEELSDCGWTEKQKRRLAPNVMAFTDRFNDVCLWTQREILASERCSRRCQTLSHFIKIAKRLLDLNNVHSAFAIVSALQCQSIYRLEKTWHGVSRGDKASLNRMKRLFDSENNWERLRDYVDSQKLPCIPYLGLYLTDLNFLHVTQKKKENFFAARPQEYMKNNIIRLLAHFQDSRYDNLLSIPCLQKVLEDDLYKQSLLREPDAPSGSFSRRSSLSRLSGLISIRSARSPTPQPEESAAKASKSKSLTPQLPLSSARKGHRKTQSVGGAGYFGVRGIENTAFVPSGLPPLPTPSSTEGDDALDAPDASMVSSSVFEADDLADDLTKSMNLSAEADDETDGFCYSPKVVAQNENERPLICDDALSPESIPVIEGVVERSVLRAHGSKPVKMRISHEYYLELRESNLFQFEKKKLSLAGRRSERDNFRRRKGKVMSMRGESGWKVMSASDSKPGFELHHPSTGRIYRYRCKSNAAAAEWRRKLLESMHNGSPRNLISLD
ncbi:hypothetical protein QR680_018899 [Steinernema hermaphroditum]|uniref:Ras-GEF domain-containing protein n=1 Tax=Steinernema hermaphroditum TaxID=289476 RepID=A0AA39HKC4_9BILA|nr:hypothetical protein QR680_018899 [Steinernema hermaphroditum]